MYGLLLSACAAFTVYGLDSVDSDLDSDSDFDWGSVLKADANICCKAQDTEFGCVNAGDPCIWLNTKNNKNLKFAKFFGAQCFVKRFYLCKKDDFRAECNDNCEGDWDPDCNKNYNKSEPICIPTYDIFTTGSIVVQPEENIGSVNVFDENLELDITFKTGLDSAPSKNKNYPILFVGQPEGDAIIEVILTGKNKMCIKLKGLGGACLGSKFQWQASSTYRVQLYYKKLMYVKVFINKGQDDEFKQSASRITKKPDMAFYNGYSETAGVYTPVGNAFARDVIVTKLTITSWMYDVPKRGRLEEDEWMWEELEEEKEYDEAVFSRAGVIGQGDAYKSVMDVKIIAPLLAIILLCGGYYLYRRRENGKYVSIDDTNKAYLV